jgi:hypothetical protein
MKVKMIAISLTFHFWTNTHFVPHILSQPHFGLSVRVKPTPPKVGTWSPLRLAKTQSASAGVKSPRIWALLVSLERS